jgi:four helix bundle suffix protein
VYLAPLLEQTAIADLLSTWNAAIEKTDRLIVAKKKHFKGLLSAFEQEGGFSERLYRVRTARRKR